MKKISTHGNRVYRIWHGMKDRCYNIKVKDYKRYGGKGIKICDEWRNDFWIFYEWAMNSGYKDDLSIDRINNDGNYEPSNCRWATMKEQHRNYSQNRFYVINGEKKCLTEWCEIYNINYVTVIGRLKRGKMNIEEALTKPIDITKRNKKCKNGG